MSLITAPVAHDVKNPIDGEGKGRRLRRAGLV